MPHREAALHIGGGVFVLIIVLLFGEIYTVDTVFIDKFLCLFKSIISIVITENFIEFFKALIWNRNYPTAIFNHDFICRKH